ncbi:MAG TPA: acyl-CoA dehydrogenase family protein [Clostridia bacterium]|nr:acyl-CoA dehydrogenase family protein [Clostridia bacterium]
MQKGGFFLLEKPDLEKMFTPEDLNEEHRLIANTVRDFAVNELEPRHDEIEEQKEGVLLELLQTAGELGLLAADIPEEYGGEGLDKVSSMLITENIVAGGSFTVAHGAHTGIGSLPIVFFGNEEQKKKYLPDLASGKKIAAYCLTEPGSGSDALAAKAKAVLSEDGKHYIINGTKQFITNAGIADVFIVYAKVDGEKFTAFIIEKGTEGLSLGAEEDKMGIKGSSTRSVILEDAKVPVENVLFEIGKGHVVAFNILNIGRYKLGAGCIGSSKFCMGDAIKYSLEREQFGRPIAKFGLIQKKIALMAAKEYAAESAVYRTAGMISDILEDAETGMDIAKGIEEYAIECSINKIFASEVLDFVVDEAVQIHGGYGYIKEYPVEFMYRDSRINRIFEGTNEVNRLIIPAMLFRKAQKGQLPLIEAAQNLLKEVLSGAMGARPGDEPLAAEQALVDAAKKIFLMVGGVAVQKYGQKIDRHQDVLGNLADIATGIFTMESALARTLKSINALGEDKSVMKANLAKLYIHMTFPEIEFWAREVLSAAAEGDDRRTQLAMLKRLARFEPIDTITLRREIALATMEAGKYLT